MDQEFLVWNLSLNDQFTSTLTSQIIPIALIAGVIFFVVTYAYNIFKNNFDTLTAPEVGLKFTDYKDLGYGIVVLIMISMYLPISKTIVGTVETINYATAVPASYSEVYNQVMANFQENQITSVDSLITQSAEHEISSNGEYKEGAATFYQNGDNTGNSKPDTEDNSGFWDSVLTSLNMISIVLNPKTGIPLILHAGCALLFAIIKFIILGISVIIVKVLVILGPLAFAFSILPVFRKQIETWFSTLVTTCMVFTTLNILDALIGTVFIHIMDPGNSIGQVNEMGAEVLALDLIMLVMYCSVFWLTGKIVGKGDAGRIISKLMTTAAAAATFAVGGGAVAAGGSTSNITNAASVGKSVIDNKKE